MANYHLEVQEISRGKSRSVTRLANYISGQRLHDSYYGRTYYKQRKDVLHSRIFQPCNAPPDFYDLQQSSGQKDAMILVLPRSSNALCPMSCLSASWSKSSGSMSAAASWRMVCAQSPRFMRGGTEMIQQRTIPISTLSYRHGPSGRTDSVPKSTANTISGSTSRFGVSSGPWYRTGPMDGTSWIYGSAMRVWKSREGMSVNRSTI